MYWKIILKNETTKSIQQSTKTEATARATTYANVKIITKYRETTHQKGTSNLNSKSEKQTDSCSHIHTKSGLVNIGDWSLQFGGRYFLLHVNVAYVIHFHWIAVVHQFVHVTNVRRIVVLYCCNNFCVFTTSLWNCTPSLMRQFILHNTHQTIESLYFQTEFALCNRDGTVCHCECLI